MELAYKSYVKYQNTTVILTSLLFALALLASQTFGLAMADLGFTSSASPYDRYMSPVKIVLAHLTNGENSMDRVCFLMHEGRTFCISSSNPYVAATPAVTSATRTGDCKAKALWLASQLNDESVRFVIGKAYRGSRMSHAWLMWHHDKRWWILDCTNQWDPIQADRVSASEYIPYYSFTKNGEFRHRATRIMVAKAGSVAGGDITGFAAQVDDVTGHLKAGKGLPKPPDEIGMRLLEVGAGIGSSLRRIFHEFGFEDSLHTS